MKRSERDALLRDVLADDEVDQLRATALTGMLDVARRRRRRRAIVSGATASLVLIATLAVVLHRDAPLAGAVARSSRARNDGAAASAGPVASTPSPEASLHSAPPVKIITDEQLLALFPDRSVALVGGPGEQRLLFLDRPANPSAAH